MRTLAPRDNPPEVYCCGCGGIDECSDDCPHLLALDAEIAAREEMARYRAQPCCLVCRAAVIQDSKQHNRAVDHEWDICDGGCHVGGL